MPRQARLDTPGTLHHVMIRGIEGQNIFRDNTDRKDFLSRIAQLIEETGTRILAWVLMNNHVHLLLFSGHQGISKFMRRLLTGYAISYNRRHQRTGHLFQNRYKSILCEEEPYLLALVCYIHLNPLRASIVKSMEELDRYPWSGHGVLVGKIKNNWQERDYVLRQFSEYKGRAVRTYRKFMEEGKDQGKRSELIGGGLIRSLGGWSQVLSLRDKKDSITHDARILGREDFVTEILKEADRNLKRQLRPRERTALIDQLIKKICKEEGVNEQELRMGGRRRKVSSARARIAYQLSSELGIPAAEIARQLGVCTSAIVKAIQNSESMKNK
ncbi:MAG: transposase [Thermodesulfobacteriota bacterium]|nr:transposase [Thermodesulfobacteriota bacterium]